MDQFHTLIDGVTVSDEYFEPPTSDETLKSALVKARTQVPSNTLKLQVLGVFSLPKGWADRPEEPYDFEVKFGTLQVNGGKVNPRLITPEEQAFADASKGKKAPKKGEEAEKLHEEIVLHEKIESEKARLEALDER